MRKFELNTVDRWGTPRVFTVEEEWVEIRPRKWIYRIRSQTGTDFFEAHFVQLDNGMLQVEVVDNHRLPEFQGMGIPDALYPRVATEKKCTIRSSRNIPDGDDPDPLHPQYEFLTPEAQRVWERLVASGDAYFDSETERWVLPKPGPPTR